MDEIIEENIVKNNNEKNSDKEFFISLFFLTIYLIFFNITFVSGTSMDPTLKHKDILIMEKASVLFNNLDRGDIISFKHTTVDNRKVFFIKRIIGIPGDTIEIKDGTVFVNGSQIEEKYIPEGTETILYETDTLEVTLKEDEYFVLGDNRNNSLDSRFEEVGVINKENITAKKIIKLLNL